MRYCLFQVLFLIPKNSPPSLDSDHFSKNFRDFVSCCLQRDPLSRPTAKELLKHKFIKNAKKSSYLTELIERHEMWRVEGGHREDDDAKGRSSEEECVRFEASFHHSAHLVYRCNDSEEAVGDLWDFGTVRNVRNPTVRSTRNTGGTRRKAPPEFPPQQPQQQQPHPRTAYSNQASPMSPNAQANGVPSRNYVPPQHTNVTSSQIYQRPQKHGSDGSGSAEGTVRSPPAGYTQNQPVARPSPRQDVATPTTSHPTIRVPAGEAPPSQGEDEEGESILDGVVLPVLDQVYLIICPSRWCSRLIRNDADCQPNR